MILEKAHVTVWSDTENQKLPLIKYFSEQHYYDYGKEHFFMSYAVMGLSFDIYNYRCIITILKYSFWAEKKTPYRF